VRVEQITDRQVYPSRKECRGNDETHDLHEEVVVQRHIIGRTYASNVSYYLP